MLVINEKTKQINITRGDIGAIDITTEEEYIFKPTDIVRIKVFEADNCDNVVLQKDIVVEEESMFVTIDFEKDDTKIGDLINEPTEYWYEIELNPETAPQTIISYDLKGEKIFKLYPEGGDN